MHQKVYTVWILQAHLNYQSWQTNIPNTPFKNYKVELKVPSWGLIMSNFCANAFIYCSALHFNFKAKFKINVSLCTTNSWRTTIILLWTMCPRYHPNGLRSLPLVVQQYMQIVATLISEQSSTDTLIAPFCLRKFLVLTESFLTIIINCRYHFLLGVSCMRNKIWIKNKKYYHIRCRRIK